MSYLLSYSISIFIRSFAFLSLSCCNCLSLTSTLARSWFAWLSLIRFWRAFFIYLLFLSFPLELTGDFDSTRECESFDVSCVTCVSCLIWGFSWCGAVSRSSIFLALEFCGVLCLLLRLIGMTPWGACLRFYLLRLAGFFLWLTEVCMKLCDRFFFS